MFGSNALASWGTSQWGAIAPEPGAVFSLDGVVSGEIEKTFELDGLCSVADQDAPFELDAIVAGDKDAIFALDFSPARPPAEVYAKLTTKPYVLVELDLAAGPVRVAGKHRCSMAKTWDARLVRSGNVLRSIGAGTDSLSLELDDTTTNGAARFRDLFTANSPEGSTVRVWIGAEGAADGDHQLVFVGKVEQVQAFSDTVARIQIVRAEQVEDVLLGQLVDLAAFPGAPEESLSTMLPMLFGTLESHEGVVIETLETGSLAYNVFAADLQVELVDASGFPAAGSIKVDAEQIDYTSKSGNVLQGLTRGAAGTSATDHGKGSEVTEVGIFSVKFASHPLGYMRRFKVELPNGNLGDPVPLPSTVDQANALATWPDGLPQIRDPDAKPTYQRIHFRDTDPLNVAINPQYAARENVGYEAFKAAQVPKVGALVLLTNTDGLNQAGDIQRVWIGVLFDPKSLTTNGAVLVAGSGLFLGTPFALQPTDIVPEAIARNDEKTGDRIYDVPPPTIDVSSTPKGFSATPQDVVDAGLFVTEQRAGLAVDKDDSTYACYLFVGAGEALVAGGGDVVFRWTQQEWESAFEPGGANKSMEIRALMGDDNVTITSPWEVYLRLDGRELPGTRFSCQSLNSLGLPAGFIRDVQEFKKDITGTFNPYAALNPPIWERVELVLHPTTGVSAGMWCVHEVSIQGLNDPPVPTVSVVQDVRNTVTNYFEVTHLVPTVNGQKDWGAFYDPNLLGRAFFFGNPREEALIVETYWVVEFTPFVAASSKVPRVFCDASGLVPTGLPTEIAREIVTRAEPEGLGLGPDRIDQGSYLAAYASLLADAVRLDFAVREQVRAVELLSRLASEADCRDTWENGVHRLVRLPIPDASIAVDHVLTCGDVLNGPGVEDMTIGKNSAREVANRLTTKYAVYPPSRGTSKTFELNDAPSQATPIGLKQGVLELLLVQDDTTANVVASRKLGRIKVTRWIVEADVPIYALNYRPGDLVQCTDPDFPFEVGEIVQVNLNTERLKRARVQIVVWKK